MILDPNDFLKMALIAIVVVVLIIVILPYLSGRVGSEPRRQVTWLGDRTKFD